MEFKLKINTNNNDNEHKSLIEICFKMSFFSNCYFSISHFHQKMRWGVHKIGHQIGKQNKGKIPRYDDNRFYVLNWLESNQKIVRCDRVYTAYCTACLFGNKLVVICLFVLIALCESKKPVARPIVVYVTEIDKFEIDACEVIEKVDSLELWCGDLTTISAGNFCSIFSCLFEAISIQIICPKYSFLIHACFAFIGSFWYVVTR